MQLEEAELSLKGQVVCRTILGLSEKHGKNIDDILVAYFHSYRKSKCILIEIKEKHFSSLSFFQFE